MNNFEWAQVVIDLFFVFAIVGLSSRTQRLERRPKLEFSDPTHPESLLSQGVAEPSADMIKNANGLAAAVRSLQSAGLTRAEAFELTKFSIAEVLRDQREQS